MSDISFSSGDESIAKIINDENDKKIIIHILNYLDPTRIPILFSYKSKMKEFTYSYNVKYPNSFSIASKMDYKRLQERPLSCESSVTADILSYMLGKKVTEYEVFDKIDKSFFNKLPFTFESKLFWWNPNVWFVWYIDYYGKKADIKPTQRDMTGYWVYEKPIAKVYNEYSLQTKIITWENHSRDFNENDHLTLLLKELYHGNMVQLWGDWCTREEYDDGEIDKWEITQEKVDAWISATNYCTTTLEDRKMEWYYIEDFKVKKHIGLVWEHAFYLLWYEGWVENPTKIIVWDSDTGYHLYDFVEWMRKWEQMNYKSIIIYKNNWQ